MNLISRARASSLANSFRRDGYENTLSGLSGARSTSNRFTTPQKLTEGELKALHDHNWLARRVVEALPDQALRKPLIAEKDSLLPFYRVNNDNRFPNGVLKHGLNMGRLHGGSAILVGVVGSGSPLAAPLPVDKDGRPSHSGDVAFLEVLTRWDLASEKKYEGHENPIMNGRTEIFKVKNGRLKGLFIHESRLIFCEGVTKATLTDEQEDRDWPWLSVLQPINEILGNYGISWTAVSHLIQESSIAWLRLKGLTDMLTSEDKKLVEERMNLLSTGRNVAKTVFLEAGDESGNGEEYGRTDVSFAGLPELMRELGLQVTGGSRIPYMVLMGDTPSGLNATGDAGLQQWYDTTEEYRTTSVKPKLETLFAATKVTAKDWSFPPLWEPTAAERADIRSKEIDGDQKLFTMSVIEPDHILESRGQDGTLGLTLDVKKILAERKAAKDGPKIEVTPTDNAKAITFNELRANQGKPPINFPGTNTPDPDGDLPLFLYEFKKTKELEQLYAPTPPAAGAPGAPNVQGQDPKNGGPDAASGADPSGARGLPPTSGSGGGGNPKGSGAVDKQGNDD